MKYFNNTETWKNFWLKRKINWKTDYLDTWNHPHRYLITTILGKLNWLSLIEIGCGSGPNLMNITQNLPGKQVGGMDVNPEAIALAKKTFVGGLFKVNSSDNLMLSDKSTDVVLSDMSLIYVNPGDIGRYIKEIKRVGRKYVVLCEFHSTSWWSRLALKFNSGYNAYNWKKLLEKNGFYDVFLYKLTEQDWPGGSPQKEFAYIVVATIPKR